MEALARPPWGLVLTFKSLSGPGGKHGETESLLGETWQLQTPVPSLTGRATPGKAGSVHLPGLYRDQGSPQPRRAAAPAPAAWERQTPEEEGAFAVAISVTAGWPRAVTPVPPPGY